LPAFSKRDNEHALRLGYFMFTVEVNCIPEIDEELQILSVR
jgi:DUF1365 family protein